MKNLLRLTGMMVGGGIFSTALTLRLARTATLALGFLALVVLVAVVGRPWILRRGG